MNKQELAQAVKAHIVLELEEAYRKEEIKAQFLADLDERVMQLYYLEKNNPTVRQYIHKAQETLIAELISEQLDRTRRALTRDEELIIEAYIKEVDESEKFLFTVARCKDLIKLYG